MSAAGCTSEISGSQKPNPDVPPSNVDLILRCFETSVLPRGENPAIRPVEKKLDKRGMEKAL